jgi:exodeoxyribonuclease VII large subunit
MTGVYTVTQINSYIKNMFRQDFVLNRLSVKGEISNCKYHTSGHIYFTLKDESGTLSAIMFAGQAKSLKIRLENGMQVIVTGHVDVYERDGKYQIYVTTVKTDGIGDLYQRYEQLKKQFEEMGYFSNEYKRSIPYFSTKIGIVTAETGAAIQDIKNISYRRNPYVSLILYPALVQGENAKYSIVKGIRTLDEMNLDVIIVGRGGGSIEDLWAFNEEIVVEAIFNAKTPIISAVGHETDFTIADFVSDLRAPTPSAAAELAVADITLIEQRILGYQGLLNDALTGRLDDFRAALEKYELHLKYLNPMNQIQEKRQYLIGLEERLHTAMNRQLIDKRHELALLASRLSGLSPLNKLSQGYSYVEGEDGKNIKTVKSVAPGDLINIYMMDGTINAKAMEVTYGKNRDA